MTFFGKVLICYLTLTSVLAFFLCASDKRRARKGGWRVPEKTLFLLSAMGGATGMLLGMLLCRHKTKHLSFMILIPLFLLLWLILLIFLQWRFAILF